MLEALADIVILTTAIWYALAASGGMINDLLPKSSMQR